MQSLDANSEQVPRIGILIQVVFSHRLSDSCLTLLFSPHGNARATAPPLFDNLSRMKVWLLHQWVVRSPNPESALKL
jgi:hypothetical protein